MEDKFKKITILDGNGNIKNIQEYKHNEHGDPIWFKKTIDGKVVTEIEYTYEYDYHSRKILMKMEDSVDGRVTVMKYEY